MAATAPAHFLGLGASRGSLDIGQRADIVWMDAELQVRGVFIGAR
jgi:N-acetylglucosamine-6-phosphate deacetylase